MAKALWFKCPRRGHQRTTLKQHVPLALTRLVLLEGHAVADKKMPESAWKLGTL